MAQGRSGEGGGGSCPPMSEPQPSLRTPSTSAVAEGVANSLMKQALSALDTLCARVTPQLHTLPLECPWQA
eukprot:scaffold19891_cov28-Tisochrysis_lutea.AAC.5